MCSDSKEKQRDIIGEEQVKKITDNARRDIRDAVRRTHEIFQRKRITRHKDFKLFAVSEK